ncbi:MAG: ribosome maturation factor [Segetibacter sp.]|nr:ribosome maturation factor [Segetibacter sp.]
MDYISAFTYICIGNETTEGNENRSLHLFYMANETIIAEVEGMLNDLLAAQPEDFLVSIKVRPTNNIKIYIDSDQGMSIEKCVRYNRKLYAQIEEKALFPEGNFSLEISSPGVDEPLKIRRQYTKNIGRNVLVSFNDETEKEGKLLEVTETDILIEQTTGKGKKAETHQFVIPFENIKTTTVQVQF